MTARRRLPAGSRVAGLSRLRLAWLQATHRVAWAAALWSCLAATAALAGLLPLIDAIAVRSGLAETLDRDGALTVEERVAGVDDFTAFERDVDGLVATRTGGALVPLSAYATAGRLHAVSVNGGSPPAAFAARELTAAYLEHLENNVDVVAGELPPEALGGGETAVTMPQSSADQLGLHLSDRFCFDFGAAGRQPRWCARLVGLWQPLSVRDPFWGERPPPTLSIGRYDLFELARLLPERPTAGLRYRPNPSLVDADRAPVVAGGVRQLAGDLASPARRVATRLDGSLERFHARQRAVSSTIESLAAAVTLLGLAVVALVAARFLEGQAREIRVLRARGWPRARVWRVAFAGPGALGLAAAPATLGACLLVTAGMSLGGLGTSVLDLRPVDLLAPAVAVAATVALLAVVLAAVAGRAAWPDPTPSLECSRDGRGGGRRPAAALALIPLGVAALALPRLPGAGELASRLSGAGELASGLSTAVGWGAAAAPPVGLLLLAAAAVLLAPLAALMPRRGIPGALAAWQLERRPGQHAGVALALAFAAAIGAFAAFALTSELAGPAPPVAALRTGLGAALGLGVAGALVLAVAGFGLHFSSAAGERLHQYGGLFTQGLAPAQAARSLALEQAATAVSSLLVGGVLGLGLGLASQPRPAPALGALGAAAVVTCLLACTLGAGALAGRMPARVDPRGGRPGI